MKNKRIYINAFNIIAFSMLVYCLAAYVYLQPKLTGAMPEPTRMVKTLGDITVPALFIVGLYHIFLLVNALTKFTNRIKNVFSYSVYVVLIVLSGIMLLVDFSLLSDIGKEYLLRDVTSQWIMLYGFNGFHILVLFLGFISLKKNFTYNNKLSKKNENGGDILFLSMHQIAFITGLLGICGSIVAMTGLVVPKRLGLQFMLLLAGLALFPLMLIIANWVVKMRKKPLSEWMDEKQMSDAALGALSCILLVVPLYILIVILDFFKLLILPVSFWILLAFFIQLTIFSMVAMIRNR